MTYTAASHQRGIEMPWLHFKESFMLSIFIYNNLQSSGGSCDNSKGRAIVAMMPEVTCIWVNKCFRVALVTLTLSPAANVMSPVW